MIKSQEKSVVLRKTVLFVMYLCYNLFLEKIINRTNVILIGIISVYAVLGVIQYVIDDLWEFYAYLYIFNVILSLSSLILAFIMIIKVGKVIKWRNVFIPAFCLIASVGIFFFVALTILGRALETF
jgi:hypothetical protein